MRPVGVRARRTRAAAVSGPRFSIVRTEFAGVKKRSGINQTITIPSLQMPSHGVGCWCPGRVCYIWNMLKQGPRRAKAPADAGTLSVYLNGRVEDLRRLVPRALNSWDAAAIHQA